MIMIVLACGDVDLQNIAPKTIKAIFLDIVEDGPNDY